MPVQLRQLAGADQFAHGGFQLEHGEHLAQLVVYLAGDARLFLLAHALQMRRQLAQARPRLAQRQLHLLVLGDVPDDPVPHHPALAQAPRGGLDIGPAQLAGAGEDAPLPLPVAVAGQGRVLG
ncbi:hypothetical protein D3C85_632190 [compost metagenome]